MSVKLFNLVGMACNATGTSTLTFTGALPGYVTASDAGALDGDEVRYLIKDGSNREIGTGTYTASGVSISRDTVLLSLEGGTVGASKISLSGAASVYLTVSKEDLSELVAFSQAFTLPTSDGTAGQVLQTNGLGVLSFVTGGSGLAPISKTTASADSAVDIALTGGYSKYYLNLENVTTSVDAAQLYIRVSDDNAVTFEATNYRYTRLNNGSITSGVSVTAVIPVIQMGTATGERTFGEVTLWPADGSHYTFMDSYWSQFNSSAALVQNSCTGLHQSTAAVTHVRFLPNSGTVSGDFHLYGIADGA